MRDGRLVLRDIQDNIARVIVGKERAVDLILTALLCGGHALIEDVPGLGKTTLAMALARSLGCSFQRIQFTPDVLPSDVTGFTLYDVRTGEKERVPGAVMSQIVLADEINRTSPKTQSSLLEVMQEGQVTLDGETQPVPQPFMVLATQNPAGLTGTYPLPEAQLDRFLLRVRMGYPDVREELRILERGREGAGVAALRPVARAQDILAMREECRQVVCSQAVAEYIVRLAQATRMEENLSLGVSPRGSLALQAAAMAWAYLNGRGYVLPDDVKDMAEPVLAHRLILHPQASYKGLTAEGVLEGVLGALRVPAVT